jgi:hypothetical protein
MTVRYTGVYLVPAISSGSGQAGMVERAALTLEWER